MDSGWRIVIRSRHSIRFAERKRPKLCVRALGAVTLQRCALFDQAHGSILAVLRWFACGPSRWGRTLKGSAAVLITWNLCDYDAIVIGVGDILGA